MKGTDADNQVTMSIQLIAQLYAYVQRLAYSELVVPPIGETMKNTDATPLPSARMTKFTVVSVAWPGIRMKEAGTEPEGFMVLEKPHVYTTQEDLDRFVAAEKTLGDAETG
jgi:hypothetical protein